MNDISLFTLLPFLPVPSDDVQNEFLAKPIHPLVALLKHAAAINTLAFSQSNSIKVEIDKL